MHTDAFISLVLLSAFLVLFYGPWQNFCTDMTRQMIFRRRDKLFDLAADGRLDFASEEYRSLRSFLEGLIRFAHELTWPQVLTMLAWYKGHRHLPRHNTVDLAPSQALARIRNPETRAIAAEMIDESVTAVLVMILLKSLVGGPVVFVLAASGYVMLHVGGRNVRRVGRARNVRLHGARADGGAVAGLR
jgi:hypothetical protein